MAMETPGLTPLYGRSIDIAYFFRQLSDFFMGRQELEL